MEEKKLIRIFIISLLTTISVFTITCSSLDTTSFSQDKPCPCENELLTSDDLQGNDEVYNQKLEFIPPYWDWRDMNGSDWTTSIKDQFQDICGSCWAFGALAGLESTIKIWKNDPSLDIDLSEQYMLSCSPGSCNGWYIDRTVKWIKTNGSIPESCFVYQANDTIPCETKCADWREKLIGIDGYKKITANVSIIQSALIQYGPLPATMTVYGDFYPGYTGGVYHQNNNTIIFGHVVTIVGYNYTEEGEGYWICKNSWGPSWGESGWFRIAFGECKIENGVYCYTGPNYVIVKPQKPTGSTKGIPGETYTYTVITIDPDNDKMKYCFDWDDGNITWTDLNNSNESLSINHKWTEKGTYNVKVKVKDEHELESDWSDPLSVSIPRNKTTVNQLFNSLKEHFLRTFIIFINFIN